MWIGQCVQALRWHGVKLTQGVSGIRELWKDDIVNNVKKFSVLMEWLKKSGH